MKSKKIAFLLKILLLVGIFAAVFGALYLIFRLTGLTQYMRDYELLTRTIRGFGAWGAIVYVIFVIIAIVVLPVPGVLVVLVGVSIYGPLYGMFLASVGTVIGSLIAFFIGRIFGKSLIFWLFGKDKANKYIKKITQKSRVPLITMLILPFFPDDMLCMAAGVSDMSYGEFIFILLITRVPVVAITAFFGSGNIIPFDGWGRIVWIIIGSLAVLGALIWFANKQAKGLVAKRHTSRVAMAEGSKDVQAKDNKEV